MGVGLRATCFTRVAILLTYTSSCCGTATSHNLSVRMCMLGHLLHRESRRLHSAGNTHTGGVSAYDIRIIMDRL